MSRQAGFAQQSQTSFLVLAQKLVAPDRLFGWERGDLRVSR